MIEQQILTLLKPLKVADKVEILLKVLLLSIDGNPTALKVCQSWFQKAAEMIENEGKN